MSILKFPLRYEGSLGEKSLYTLFDLGATFSCVNPDYVEDLEKLIPPDEFMLVPKLSEEAILGVATLQKWRIKL